MTYSGASKSWRPKTERLERDLSDLMAQLENKQKPQRGLNINIPMQNIAGSIGFNPTLPWNRPIPTQEELATQYENDQTNRFRWSDIKLPNPTTWKSGSFPLANLLRAQGSAGFTMKGKDGRYEQVKTGVDPIFAQPFKGAGIKKAADIVKVLKTQLAAPQSFPVEARNITGNKGIAAAQQVGKVAPDVDMAKIASDPTTMRMQTQMMDELGLRAQTAEAAPKAISGLPPVGGKVAGGGTVPPMGVPPVVPPMGVPPPVPLRFNGVQISSVPELMARITKQRLTGTAKRVMDLPGLNRAGKVVNPIAVADDAGTVLRSASGMIDDQIRGGTILEMADMKLKSPRVKSLFNLDNKGVVSHPNIKQISSLPNGKQSMALHDIIEYADRYDMGTDAGATARNDFLKSARETSQDISNMLRNEGILVDATPQPGQIRAVKGETGFQFLHRVLTTVKDDATDALSNRVSSVLKNQNVSFPKQTGEANYNYLTRFAESVQNGTIPTSKGIDDMLDEFASIADVNIKKSSMSAKRKWETMADGLKAGNIYEPNPAVELDKQIRASYELVKKKRLGELVLSQIATTTPVEKAASELGVVPETLHSASKASSKLVTDLQHIVRGESPSGGTITQIRKLYPRLGAQLDSVLAILPKQRNQLIRKVMNAAIESVGITGKDTVTIAKRAETLANIKLAFKGVGTAPNITRTDIVDVIRQTIADKTIAGRLEKILYADMSKQQKLALKQILANAKVIQATDSNTLKVLTDLTAKYTERMGPLGTIEYGRVPGIPDLANRVIVPQDGKMGQEIADSIRKNLGYMSDSGGLTKAVGEVGSVMQMMRLGFDFSATLIQQLMSLGFDIKNMVKLKPTNTWAKATGGAFKSLVSRDLNHFDAFITQNHDIVRDLIQRGGLIESAEFTEGANVILRLAHKLPEGRVSNITNFIGKHVISRSDAVFTTGRVEAAVNMYKAGYAANSKTGTLDEWAKLVNEMTGVLSSRAMGIGDRQRNLEGALVFLSPRFTRANGAIIAHIIANPTSYTAKEAGTSLAAIIAAGTTLYATINGLQDEDVTLNPFDPNYGNIVVGNRIFRLGGIMNDARRLLGVIDAATYAVSGHNLSLSGKEDKTLSLDRLGFSQFKGKTTPITGSTIDIIRMMTDRGATDFDGNPLSWAGILGNWITPSWSDPVLNGEEDALMGTIASSVGLTTYPISEDTGGTPNYSPLGLGGTRNVKPPPTGLPGVRGLGDSGGLPGVKRK